MPKVELKRHELPYAVAEEMNTLRTNIQFSGDKKRVILLTSCLSGDGKSTISLELARSMANLGKKVLLIDTDMRKSKLRKKVAAGRFVYGLSHYLAGRQSIEEIVYETETPNVSVIPAGIVPPNPSELLSSDAFAALIQWARGQFDYVFVDCPPLGMVVDAAIVSKQCDGSVFVINAAFIHRRMAQEVADKLRNAGCPILGVVLNRVSEKTSGYYYRHTYGYGYGNKYAEYGEKHS